MRSLEEVDLKTAWLESISKLRQVVDQRRRLIKAEETLLAARAGLIRNKSLDFEDAKRYRESLVATRRDIIAVNRSLAEMKQKHITTCDEINASLGNGKAGKWRRELARATKDAQSARHMPPMSTPNYPGNMYIGTAPAGLVIL